MTSMNVENATNLSRRVSPQERVKWCTKWNLHVRECYDEGESRPGRINSESTKEQCDKRNQVSSLLHRT